MRKLPKLVVMLAILVYGLMASPSAFAHAVLVLSSGSAELDAQLRVVLQSQGHVVTIGSDFRKFTGDGLAGQNVVFLWPILDDGNSDMPLDGQNAIVNFVSAGGGLVASEWTAYMSAFRSFQALIPILPVPPSVPYSESRAITYKEATPDSVLNAGVLSPLSFNADFYYGTETYFAPRAGATVFYTSSGGTGGAGVVGWPFASGRVIQLSTVAGPQELANANYSRLVANVVWWAGTTSKPRVTDLKFEPATVQAGGLLVARFAGTNLAEDLYLDVRFRAPGGSSDEVALNWQQGTSAGHAMASNIGPGAWTVTGVRAHQNRDTHSGDFDAVSATLAVILPTCFVTTSAGNIQGQDLGASCAFLGIPYAAAPAGNLRWKPPSPGLAWSPSTLFATSLPSNCAAINQAGVPAGSEDCLKVNVWVPKPIPSQAAVIVWLHTGSFVASSANFAANNGQRLAEQNGVIVVAPNYRLGPFGFLAHDALTNEDRNYHSSGNYGLLDQRAALVWVRNNIASLGGDPEKVTLAGQSAGAESVGFHLVSPGSAGLFQRAVMQSGYASSRQKTREEGESQGNDLAAALGCTNPLQVLSCMRSKSPAEVLRALPTASRWEYAETPIHWGPVVDGIEIPDQPRFLYERGAFHHVPLLLGATRDEGWIYVDRTFPADITATQYESAVEMEFGRDASAILARYRAQDFASSKEALSQLTGEVEYVCEAIRVADLVARTMTPVYLYSFEYVVGGLGSNHVIHGLDTNFVFGNNFVAPFPDNHVFNAADLALSNSMRGYWARFAATGDPNRMNDASVVRWTGYQHPTPIGSFKYLILDSVVRESTGLRMEQCDFLHSFFFRSVNGAVPASAQ